MQKKYRINIRVNEKENDFINERSEKFSTKSECIRDLIQNEMPTEHNQKILQKLNQMNHYLLKIGTNINQIAKNNNSELYSESDRVRLLKAQKEIEKQFGLLSKFLRGDENGNN